MRTEFGLKCTHFVQPYECFSFTKLSNFSKMSVRRFIFKSHLLYWTRNTQTTIANGGEKKYSHSASFLWEKKDEKNMKEGVSVWIRLWHCYTSARSSILIAPMSDCYLSAISLAWFFSAMRYSSLRMLFNGMGFFPWIKNGTKPTSMENHFQTAEYEKMLRFF